MRRWLVALALAVVVMPDARAAAAELRVDLARRTVTSTTSPPLRSAPIAALPANVAIDHDRVRVRAGGLAFQHRIADLWWRVTTPTHLVLGEAAVPGGHADRIVGIDHTTGRVAWRRKVDSQFAAALVGELVAVERAGALDIVDARTGQTLDTTPLVGHGIQAISRTHHGLHVKTSADLIAIATTGRVQWTRDTSSRGNLAATQGAVVDAWVDRTRHRYGIVTYDPQTGAQLESVDLGPTSGWYDYERVELSLDAAGEVLVSSVFGTT